MIKIFGKGGHSKVVKSFLNDVDILGVWDEFDFRDSPKHGKWIIAIGDNKIRRRIAEDLLGESNFISIISKKSLVRGKVSYGTSVHDFSTIQIDSIIGSHCIINTSAVIDHDCNVGSFVHIAPNTTLCGGVSIGDGTIIGAGSVVLPGISVGKDCIIGAGSVVNKDIPDNRKAWGNPIKFK